MKNRLLKRTLPLILVMLLVGLWFTDVLPKQVAGALASSYLSRQQDGAAYRLKEVEYSPAHDCYFAYFEHSGNAQEQRNIGVYYRWLPFDVFFDSAYPG